MRDDQDGAPEVVGDGRSTAAGDGRDARPARPLPWDADATPALAQGLGLVCLFVAVAGVVGLALSWDGGLLDLLMVVEVAVAFRVALYFLRLARRGRRGRV